MDIVVVMVLAVDYCRWWWWWLWWWWKEYAWRGGMAIGLRWWPMVLVGKIAPVVTVLDAPVSANAPPGGTLSAGFACAVRPTAFDPQLAVT